MKKSMEALLLSAFVFPGAGHLYLKSYVTGLLLIAASGASLWVPLRAAVESALQLAGKIETGIVPPDIAVIMDLVTKEAAAVCTPALNSATAVMAVCWLIGVVDSYRVGRAKDKMGESAAE